MLLSDNRIPYVSDKPLLEGVSKVKIEYDPEIDLMNIEFLAGEPIVDSIEIEGVIIDYSEDRKIVAIEILDAGKRTQKNPLSQLDLSIVREAAVV